MQIEERNRLNEAIARSGALCPGGLGCECCQSYCDCGCRDACPVFRGMIYLSLVKDAQPASAEEK